MHEVEKKLLEQLSDTQQLDNKGENLTEGDPNKTNSQTSVQAPSLLWQIVMGVACTLLASALGAGIAIAVMTLLLEMPIVLGIVVIAGLGSAALAAGGFILWNVCSNKNDGKDLARKNETNSGGKSKNSDKIVTNEFDPVHGSNQSDSTSTRQDYYKVLSSESSSTLEDETLQKENKNPTKIMSSRADVSASKSGSEYESEENQPEPLQEETASETMQNEDEVTPKEENSPGTTPVSENLGDEKILNMPVSELEVPAVPNKENQEDLPEEIKSDKSTPVIKSKSSGTDEILNQPEEIKSNKSTSESSSTDEIPNLPEEIKSNKSTSESSNAHEDEPTQEKKTEAEFVEEATQEEKIEAEEISVELQGKFNKIKSEFPIQPLANLLVAESSESSQSLAAKMPAAVRELEGALKNMKKALGYFVEDDVPSVINEFFAPAIDTLINRSKALASEISSSENDRLDPSLIIGKFNALCEDASSVNDILIWMDILHPLDETQVTQNNRNALLNTINCLIASYRTRGDLNTNTSAPVSDKTSQKEIKESVSKSGKSKSSSTLKNETLQKEKPCPNPAHRKNKPSLSKAGKRMSSDTQKQAQKMKSEMDFLSCLADQKLLPTDEDNRMTNKPVYKRYGKYLNAINGQSESCGKYIVIIEQHIKGLKEKIIGDLNAKPENSEKRQFFNDIETHLTNQNNTKNDLDDFLIATDEKIKEEDISSDIFSEMTAHCTSFNKLCREMDQLANLIICIEILASDNCNQTDVRNWRASIIAQSKKLQLGNVKALLAAIKKAKKASFDSTKGTKLVPRALELEQTGNVSISSDKNGMSLGEKRIPIKNLSQAVFKWFTGDTCPLKGTILNLLIDQDSLENLQSGIQFIETGKNKFAKVRDFFKQEKNDLEKHVNDKDPSKAAIVQLIKAQGIAQIENLQTAMEKLENKVEPIGATSGAIDVNSVEDYANQFNALCFNAYCLCKTISHAITQIENVKCDFDEKSLKNIADQVKDYQVNKNPFIESSLPLINLENIVIATPEISKENASAPVTQEEQKSFFGKILGFLWK